MAIEQASFHCPQCRQQRLFTRQGTNHVIHLLITLFLCGLWIPIWILIAISNGNNPFFCSQCGYSGTPQMLRNPYGNQYRQAQQIRRPSEPTWIGRKFNSYDTKTQFIIVFVAVVVGVGLITLIGNQNRNTTQFVSSPTATPTPYVADTKPIYTPTVSPTAGKINSSTKTATVIAENASLRKSGSQTGELIEILPADSTVEVIKQSGAWFYVRSAGGQQGWMHGNTIRYVNGGLTTSSTTTAETIRTPRPQPTVETNPSGATARCRDGTLSYSAHRRGTCSHHGGVAVWY